MDDAPQSPLTGPNAAEHPLDAFLRAEIENDSAVAFFAGQDEEHFGPLAAASLAEDDHRVPHANRWSPTRVLASVPARRELVDLHPTGQHDCPGSDRSAPCLTLRLLAVHYAGTPGYRVEWRP